MKTPKQSPAEQVMTTILAPKLAQHEWLFLRKSAYVAGTALQSATCLGLVGKGLMTADGKITELGKLALAKGFVASAPPHANAPTDGTWVPPTATAGGFIVGEPKSLNDSNGNE